MKVSAGKQVLYYYLFVLVVLAMISGLLYYNIQTRVSSFNANQQRLMSASVSSTGSEISLLIKELRRMVGVFGKQHETLLQKVADNPLDQEAQRELNRLVQEYFPSYHAVSLGDRRGEVILEDDLGFVGNMCRNDLRGFAENPHQPHVYVHPSGKGYHFDIMNTWGDGQVLFVSFKLEEVARLISDNELPDHDLFLVKRDRPELIEVSSTGGGNSMMRDATLSDQEMQRIRVRQPVADTLWELVDLPEADLFPGVARQAWIQNAIILSAFAGMLFLMLWLLLREHRKTREAETQVMQSAKMASLGQMVAGVSHEINTPLGYVKSNVEMLGEQIGSLQGLTERCRSLQQMLTSRSSDPGRLRDEMNAFFALVKELQDEEVLSDSLSLVDDSRYGLESISELVQNLKDFSRIDGHKVEGYNLNDGLETTLKIAGKSIPDNVEIRKEFGKIPEIRCAPSRINQVFLNLITNAVQAMDNGGSITLRTGVENNEVFVRVIDTGKGIPKKDLKHVFDPFFTTKEVGEGTGLGLSISYKIVEDHGGRMEVDSIVGKGSIFTVWLPIG